MKKILLFLLGILAFLPFIPIKYNLSFFSIPPQLTIWVIIATLQFIGVMIFAYLTRGDWK